MKIVASASFLALCAALLFQVPNDVHPKDFVGVPRPLLLSLRDVTPDETWTFRVATQDLAEDGEEAEPAPATRSSSTSWKAGDRFERRFQRAQSRLVEPSKLRIKEKSLKKQ